MNDEEGDVKKVDWVGSVEKERRQLRREIDRCMGMEDSRGKEREGKELETGWLIESPEASSRFCQFHVTSKFSRALHGEINILNSSNW